jgi:hypothetical protein
MPVGPVPFRNGPVTDPDPVADHVPAIQFMDDPARSPIVLINAIA